MHTKNVWLKASLFLKKNKSSIICQLRQKKKNLLANK